MERFLPKSERRSRELTLANPIVPLDLKEVFGNNHPVALEIGIGKGYFIQHAATAHPEENFIGIEVRRKYLNLARGRVEKRPLSNARFVCGEAFTFMEAALTCGSLQSVHVYFPDPWPKKRHHKRRLFSAEFLKLVYERLVPGGHLLIATDHRGYWEHICQSLREQSLLNRCPQVPEPPLGAEGLTNYDIKYQREGREIFRVVYTRS